MAQPWRCRTWGHPDSSPAPPIPTLGPKSTAFRKIGGVARQKRVLREDDEPPESLGSQGVRRATDGK